MYCMYVIDRYWCFYVCDVCIQCKKWWKWWWQGCWGLTLSPTSWWWVGSISPPTTTVSPGWLSVREWAKRGIIGGMKWVNQEEVWTATLWKYGGCPHVFPSLQACMAAMPLFVGLVLLGAWQPCILADKHFGSPLEPITVKGKVTFDAHVYVGLLL